MIYQNIPELIGNDLPTAVFAHFPLDTKLYLKGDIMPAFYQASKNPAYREFFANYPFDTDGAVPYSRSIREGISTLCALDMMNTTYSSSFEIYKSVEISFRKFISPRLDERQNALLKQLAEEMKKELLA